MEDRNNRAKQAYRAWTHFIKRRRAKNFVDHHGNNYDYSEARGNDNYSVVAYDELPPYDPEITAPFNTAAFIQYLDNRDRNFYNPPELNDSYGTHYYGDDCPGGHNND